MRPLIVLLEQPESETIQLEKGLDPKEALRQAAKKCKYDRRGGNYNPETGKAVMF